MSPPSSPDRWHGIETIECFLQSSYDTLAEGATVATFLPLLTERFAEQRLRALARGVAAPMRSDPSGRATPPGPFAS